MTHSVTLTLSPEDTVQLLSSQPLESKLKHETKAKVQSISADNTVFFVLLIGVWYAISVGHNLLNKRLLEGDLFPFPFTLTLLQLSSITIYSLIYIKYFSSDDRHVIVTISDVINHKRNRNLILFLSLGKFLTLVFSHLSLSQIPLAFTHTGEFCSQTDTTVPLIVSFLFPVKGSLPIFVVVLSRIFLRTTHTREVYLSLIPIVAGVSLVSFQSPTHNPNLFLGIVFAFVSTLNLALLNVFSKKLLSTTFSAISLLHLLTKLSLLFFIPFYILLSLTHRLEVIERHYFTPQLPFIFLLDGALSFSQNILAFSLLSLCSPLTYSIANCSKRVAIICLSLMIFSVRDITFQSGVGIAVSLLGICCYNMAKHREKSKIPEKKVNRSTEQGDNEFDRHSLGSFYNV